MKKFLAFSIAAFALFAVSCKQELTPETSGHITKVFTVSAPESTRTALSGKTDVIWSEGDKINVIADGTGNEYTFTLKSGSGSASAKFEGTVDEVDAEETVFYAVYPNINLYKDSPHHAGNTTLEFAKANTDAEQPALAVESGYDPRLAVMTAVLDEEGNFQFRHAVAYLKLTIGNENVKSIKLTSAGGARIYGRVTVSIETGKPTAVNGASSTTNFVNLAPESGTFVKDAFYLIPITIKPENSLGDVTLLATDANGLTDERTHGFSSIKPEAGKIYDLGKPVFEFSSVPKLTLDKKSVTGIAAAAATDLKITDAYTIKNCTDSDVTVTYDGTVVTAASIASGTVTYSVSANTGDEREGWIGLNLAGGEVLKITVKQNGKNTATDLTAISTTTEWTAEANFKALAESKGTNVLNETFIDNNLKYICGGKIKFNANYLRFDGTGSRTNKCVQFMIAGPGTLTVSAKSANSSATDRKIGASHGTTDLTVHTLTTEYSDYTWEISSANSGDIISIYSANSGINVKSIKWTPK